ncbi:MAG: hypothetical protein ACKER6_00145 [Candidatus Hodgkinia cicadicola]
MMDLLLACALKREQVQGSYDLNLSPSVSLMTEEAFSAQANALTFMAVDGRIVGRSDCGRSLINDLEHLAAERAKSIFKCGYAVVLTNDDCATFRAVSSAFLLPEDTVLAPSGSRFGLLDSFDPNIEVVSYSADEDTATFDVDQVLNLAILHRPKLIIVDAALSAQPINWKHFREIADAVDARLVADISHACGAIIIGAYPSPVPYCHAVTCSTHLALRGPHGGLILTNDGALFEQLNQSVERTCLQPHVLAAKAAALSFASTDEFKAFTLSTLANANVFALALSAEGLAVRTSRSCNLTFVNVKPLGLTAKQAWEALNDCFIRINDNDAVDATEPRLRLGAYLLTISAMPPLEIVSIAYAAASVLRQTVKFGIVPLDLQAQVRRLALALSRQYFLLPPGYDRPWLTSVRPNL